MTGNFLPEEAILPGQMPQGKAAPRIWLGNKRLIGEPTVTNEVTVTKDLDLED